jgi:hypothetical protein
VFEAMDAFQIDPTSMSYICMVVEILHMLWMGTWTCPHSVPPLLEAKLEFWVTARPQTVGCAVFEAMDPLQTDPTSMSYIHMPVENLHMLWMGTWTCPHSVPLL